MAAITSEQALQIALAHYSAGRPAEAEGMCRQVLATQPQHAGALHVLGLIAASTQRCEEALDLLQRAVAHCPQRADFQANLGVLYRRLGRAEEAVPCLERAVAIEPASAELHMNLGDALHAAERFDEAIASARQAIALRPNYAEAYNNLGNALERTRQWAEALASLERATALAPQRADFQTNLGALYRRLGHPGQAAACFERAIAINPSSAESHMNLGDAFFGQERFDDAIRSARQALALQPDYAEALTNLGVAHWAKGHFATALQCYESAVVCQPELATAHWNLGTLLLFTGRYEEGWRECEWRGRECFSHIPRRHFSAPRWDGGAAPESRLLLHAEQGVGDAIQFLRYVPLARERAGAAHLILECPPSLTRLITQSGEWGAEIVTRQSWDGAALPPFDLHLPWMSLPFAVGLFDPLTMPRPYLHAPPAARRACRELLAPTGLRVGLVWAGNPQHQEDRRRSIVFERLRPLLRVPEVHFYSLQIEPRVPMNAGVTDLAPHLTDFADTAAFVGELDLVITVDTATAHLAGALGRPVWTLLPFVPDWRWGLAREDTPWYPTMRLFRQKTAGDWDEVVKRVAEELRTLTSQPRASALSANP